MRGLHLVGGHDGPAGPRLPAEGACSLASTCSEALARLEEGHIRGEAVALLSGGG